MAATCSSSLSHLIHYPEKNKNQVIHPILVDNPREVDISQVKIAVSRFGTINICSKCLHPSSLVSKLNCPLQSWSSMWCPLYLQLLTFVEGNKDASPCVYIYESRVYNWEVICFMCPKQLLSKITKHLAWNCRLKPHLFFSCSDPFCGVLFAGNRNSC